MALDNNVKSVRTYAKEINPQITVTIQGCLDKATELGLDANKKLTTAERKTLAQALCEKTGSQLAPLQESSTIARQEPKTMPQTTPENSLSVRPVSALNEAPNGALNIREIALQIRNSGDKEKTEIVHEIMADFAMGFMNEQQTLERLQVLVNATSQVFAQKVASIIKEADSSAAASLEDLKDALATRRSRATEAFNAEADKFEQMLRDYAASDYQKKS